MNAVERRSTFALSLIMALRMLGLFMILPVFSLYAEGLIGTKPALIGIAIGIYGLTQSLLQIPFGMLSDHIGRKKMIVFGLMLFAIGSAIAAMSHTIWGVIIGRALQGAGAIGSTIMATIADLTSEQHRTKAMAMIGMTIGLSFSLAMILGPIFTAWIHVNGIFWLTVLFAAIAILILFILVPNVNQPVWHPEAEPDMHQFSHLLKNPDLAHLNISIFILHLILTANFVILPLSLQYLAGLHGNQQWLLYLPILFLAFLLSIPCIVIAEKKHCIKLFFLAAIMVIALAEFFLRVFAHHLLLSAFSLLLFFTAFSLLEAFLPSLISRTAPPARKGTAMGIYSSAQFLGIFIGGIVGGWLLGQFGLTYVYLFCGTLSVIWLLIVFKMKQPHYQK